MSSGKQHRFDDAAAELCKARGWALKGYAGGGAFKHVYRVERPSNADEVALKLVRGKSPRTVREIETLKRCNHTNVSKLHDHGAFDLAGAEYDFTVEEFLAGGTLAERLPSAKQLDRQSTIALGNGLIAALAHVFPVVHRDIKPANIMYRDHGDSPVLVDFGLARDLEDSSLTPTWVDRGPGTPYFAPPEQLNNEKNLIDWRSDQFSLGVVLSLAHLGVHPYQTGDSPLPDPSTVDQVANRSACRVDLAERCMQAGLPCILKMVKPWPVERFRTPRALLDAWQQQG